MPVTTSHEVKISILMDNRAGPGYRSEHGFAVWIEADKQKVLFDTGSSDALAENAARMGINLQSANQLVLSHGHYDHTGSVEQRLHQNPHMQVLMHPKAIEQRYSIHPGQAVKDVSMPLAARTALLAHPSSQRTTTEEPHQLWYWLGSSGAIPRTNPLEDTGGPFFMDTEGRVPDLIEDDLALWIKTPSGLVILTGCCHAGLINTVEQIKRVTGETSIYAIIGGLHLKNAQDDRIQATLNALKQWDPAYLIPCHCTGDRVMDELQQELGFCVKQGYAGMQLKINQQISTLN
ncbi:MBL fold metallo-hydrolase [Pontiellaceae bacterium B12227]|nr:MBL fold metallo-hydrolase [Pontiellaceae bacterium B12227]